MSEWKAKRFWTESSVVAEGNGYGIRLDGRSVKTPAKRELIVPTQAMAQAIAAEWDAQDGVIDPSSMPVTKTANAAIDKVALQHAEVADMLAEYGDADLLCYRADSPAALVARQAAQWDPMLEWAADVLGARLQPRTGITHAPQDARALETLRRQTHAMSPFELAAFHDLVSLSGSLVLGFAATQDAKPVETLWDISRLDEIWQIEQWGKDEEAEEMASHKKDSFLHAHAMFTLCRTPC